jgi:hypothetical protein
VTGAAGFDAAAAQLRRAVAFEAENLCTAKELAEQLDEVFTQFNIDVPETPWAQFYRAGRNRSLSGGDVIVIGESAWAVARDRDRLPERQHRRGVPPPRERRCAMSAAAPGLATMTPAQRGHRNRHATATSLPDEQRQCRCGGHTAHTVHDAPEIEVPRCSDH